MGQRLGGRDLDNSRVGCQNVDVSQNAVMKHLGQLDWLRGREFADEQAHAEGVLRWRSRRDRSRAPAYTPQKPPTAIGCGRVDPSSQSSSLD